MKVQIPQVTGDPEALALVYDKDRKWLVQQRLDNTTKDAMGTDVRAFFRGKVSARDRLVEDQQARE